MMGEQLYDVEIPGGAGWSVVVRRGRALTLTALASHANVSMLVYAVDDPTERLNLPDTFKAQTSACVRPPMTLMSDMGRALLTVTGSSLDWHDALTGHSLDADVAARYGVSSYQEHRNDWRRSARSCLLEELRVHDLDVRDLHATVNWFTKVQPADDERATLSFVDGYSREGDFVSLRAEIDVLVVLATSPHPLDPAPDWQPAPIRAVLTIAAAPGADDPARLLRDETARSLLAAERSYA
jgi:urea carboxylase-associated protein 2